MQTYLFYQIYPHINQLGYHVWDIREDMHALKEGLITGGKQDSSNLCPCFYTLSGATFSTLYKRKLHTFQLKCLLLYCELG